MTELFVAVGVLLLLTGLVVAASLLVENGGRVRAPATTAGPRSVDEPRREASPVELLLDDDGARTQLLAAVLASYAAARRPEANRVAAWVTSSGWPPGRTGSAYRPGVNLRGRPAAVAQLLACDVERRCWFTVNPSVDIDRGLRARPPECEVLAGVCALRDRMLDGAPLGGDQLGRAADALRQLEPSWQGTVVADALDELVAALSEAEAAGTSVVVRISPVAPVGQLRPDRTVARDEPVSVTA